MSSLLKKVSNPFVDTYTRRARLEPALLVALPLGLTVVSLFPTELATWGTVWGLIAWSGGTALLAQVARDRGKRKEAILFASWGGAPTTRMLRHRDATNAVLLQRRHEKLHKLLPGVKIPTAAGEAKDPAHADEVYEACVAHLRERTRKQKRFALVFSENCNYGFRRNMWGMKPIGIGFALLGTVLVGAGFVQSHLYGVAVNPIAAVCALINLILLAGWIYWFTPEWVRIPAEAYAERLLAACEDL